MRRKGLRALVAPARIAAFAAWVMLAASAPASRALAGPKGPGETASDLLFASRQLARAGKYEEAIASASRSLALWEGDVGPEGAGLVEPLDYLAELRAIEGDDAAASRLRTRAIAILEARMPEDPRLVDDLLALARIHLRHGDDGAAEPLVLRATALAEAASATHPELATLPLFTGAALAEDQGDLARAEALLVRARGLLEAASYPGHISTVWALTQLGALHRRRGDVASARPLLEEARALFVQDPAWKEQYHEAFVASGVELATLYADTADARAEPLFREMLDVVERAMGAESPVAARCRSDLGALRLRAGDAAGAEVELTKALAVREKILGPLGLDVATTLGHLSDLRADRGDLPGAIAARRRAAEIRDLHGAMVMASGTEARKRMLMASQRADTAAVVSLHVLAAPASAEAAELALTTILRRKGRVLDAMAGTFATVRRRADAEAQGLLDQLGAIDQELATLVTRGPGEALPAAHLAKMEDLDRRREQIEARVAERSAAFRADLKPLALADVRRAIPEDAALIEIVRLRPLLGPVHRTPAERWQPPIYVAYVVRRTGPIRSANLGAAARIDALAAEVRRALAEPSSNPRPVARALDALVMQPLDPLLGGVEHLLVSPDGALGLVPFGALLDEAGRYRIERATFTYLTSGRDLVRLQAPFALRGPPLVIASPSFGALPPEPSASNAATSGAAASRGARSVDLASAMFPPIPGTAREGRAIAGMLAGAELDLGDAATEGALKAARAPRVLHIATHGFFLPDESDAEAGGDAALEGLANARLREDPLLRSGLAFAGANARVSGARDDGVLTALEASALDLDGTELVVLSACETGVGRASASDGVFGLRRAFVIAGAATQVMSLWQVEDDSTSALMISYYDRLLAGGGRSTSLRDAELAMLRAPDTAHPFFWAGFIASGAEGPLASGASLARVSPGPRGCACSIPAGDPDGRGSVGGWLFAGALTPLRRRRRQDARRA